MAQYDWTENYGQIGRLYPTNERVYFTLKGGKTAMNPVNGYYYVPTSHDNYTAMIDLLYTAADRRWKIYARTKETLVDGHAEVIYFVVDW